MRRIGVDRWVGEWVGGLMDGIPSRYLWQNFLSIPVACMSLRCLSTCISHLSTLLTRAMRVTRQVQRSQAIVLKPPVESLLPTLASMNQVGHQLAAPGGEVAAHPGPPWPTLEGLY